MTLTTRRQHPSPHFQKASFRPPLRASVSNSLPTIGDGQGRHNPVTATIESGSSLYGLGISPGNSVAVSLTATLHNHKFYNKYFAGKIYVIKQLEDEIKAVKMMTDFEFKEYKRKHCPCINSRTKLTDHNFYWISFYSKQILNVLNDG